LGLSLAKHYEVSLPIYMLDFSYISTMLDLQHPFSNL